MVRGHHDAVVLVHGVGVSAAAAVGHPSAGALLHQGVNGGGDTAGGSVTAKLAIHKLV